MHQYHELVRRVLNEGVVQENRTGTSTLAVPGAIIKHDMADGAPLVTTKRVGFRNIRTELEFFINGLTDKRWLQERGNHIWDDWCSPKKVPYGHDAETKGRMAEEPDLGPIYGFQWRHFGAEYKGLDHDYTGEGVDQLASLVDKLHDTPNDRRMIVSAWNPTGLDEMALPPCHYSFEAIVLDNKLNLIWNQRSVDVALGLPYNIASYGLLLHLLAKEGDFDEGSLIGHLGNVHIYGNHISGLEEQLERDPYELPHFETRGFEGRGDFFNWTADDTKLVGYKSHPAIKFPIAV